MKFTQIHASRITRTILGWFRDHGRDLPYYGDESAKSVQMTVQEMLTDPDSILQETLEEHYNELTGRFGCPLSVEEALIYGTTGFNPEPMEAWVNGKVAIDRAIEMCFEQTFIDAICEVFDVKLPKESGKGLKVVKN